MTSGRLGSGTGIESADRAIAIAKSKLGSPYVWATAGPDTFDCSGFTWWVASQVLGPLDYELRSSHHQFNVWGEAVRADFSDPLRPDGLLLPGDLVFYDTMGVEVMGNAASHVALYVGNGEMVGAVNETLGVRIDRLDSPYYASRYIGARRIFDLDAEPVVTTPPKPYRAPRPRKTLPKIDTLPLTISTPNQWNGGGFPVGWAAVYQWRPEIEAAASSETVDARAIATVMMMESQGVHWRDGQLLTVWDNFPEDGPAVGLMQIKPQVWGWLAPELDPTFPVQNVLLGAKIIRYLLDNQAGGNFGTAMGLWFPAHDPNGSTPDSYMRTFWGLMGELGYAAT